MVSTGQVSVLSLCDYLWKLSSSLWLGLEALRSGRRISSEEFWDSFADEFVKRVRQDEGIERFTQWQLSRIEAGPRDVVLDCGCGFGRLSIPLAKRCQVVYAVDQCKRLLDYLTEFAKIEGVQDRIRVICGKWEKLRPGIDIPHTVDVVVVSHSLELDSLSEGLKFLVNITGKCCHIFHDVLPLMFEEYHMAVSKILGNDILDLYPSPAAIIYLALNALGVCPSVEIFIRKSIVRLRKLEDILHGRISKILPVDNPRVRDAVLDVFRKCIIEEKSDCVIIEAHRPIAHIWWYSKQQER